MNFYFIIALSLSLLISFSIIEGLKVMWPKTIDSPSLFQIFAIQGTHIIAYICVNTMYAIIYYLNHPFFEQYKVEKSPWPWQQISYNWIELRNNTILNFIMQIIIGSILSFVTMNKSRLFKQIIIELQFISQHLDSLPSYPTILFQLIFCLLIEDFLFYWAHRIIHHPLLYRFHKQHHTYTVTSISSFLKALVSIAGEYTHPVEYIFGNLIPFVAGPTIFGSRMHLVTLMYWISIRVYKTLSTHSGYVFPWEIYQYIPGVSESEFHSFHHSQNIGNFGGMLKIWDLILGTDANYYKLKEKSSYGILKLKTN